MTLVAQTPRCSYVGDGSNQTFATTFTFELAEELTVWRGAPTVADCCTSPAYDNLLVRDVDYVLAAGDWLVDGGTITVQPTAAIADGEQITLMRTTSPDQPNDFGDDQAFSPEAVEAIFDRVTRMIQELYQNPLGMIVGGGLAWATRSYSPDPWFDDTPLDVINFDTIVSFAADWGASVATVEAYDAAEKVVSLQDQTDTEVGTITIPAVSGAVVMATTGDGWTSSLRGQLRLIPPEGGLGSAQGLAVTFAGTLG